MKRAILLICAITTLSGCAGQVITRTVKKADGSTIITKAPANLQAWESNQKSLRDLQKRGLDLLIEKEKTNQLTLASNNQTPSSSIVNVAIGYDSLGEPLDDLPIGRNTASDDSTSAGIASINAMRDVSKALIVSSERVDPAVSKLLNDPGLKIPDSAFVANTKAVGTFAKDLSPFLSGAWSGLINYLIVDTAVNSQQSPSISVGGGLSDSAVVSESSPQGTGNQLSIPGQTNFEYTVPLDE